MGDVSSMKWNRPFADAYVSAAMAQYPGDLFVLGGLMLYDITNGTLRAAVAQYVNTLPAGEFPMLSVTPRPPLFTLYGRQLLGDETYTALRAAWEASHALAPGLLANVALESTAAELAQQQQQHQEQQLDDSGAEHAEESDEESGEESGEESSEESGDEESDEESEQEA